MKISNNDGSVEIGGLQLTLDMPFTEVRRAAQALHFEESSLTINRKTEGAIFSNDSGKLIDSWRIYLQVFEQSGIVGASFTYIDEHFPPITKWDAELEERRKQQHIEFLSEWGLKRKTYSWGSINVVKDRSHKFAAIVLYYKKSLSNPSFKRDA